MKLSANKVLFLTRPSGRMVKAANTGKNLNLNCFVHSTTPHFLYFNINKTVNVLILILTYTYFMNGTQVLVDIQSVFDQSEMVRLPQMFLQLGTKCASCFECR